MLLLKAYSLKKNVHFQLLVPTTVSTTTLAPELSSAAKLLGETPTTSDSMYH